MYEKMPREFVVEDYTFDELTKAFKKYKDQCKLQMLQELRLMIKKAQHAISTIQCHETDWAPGTWEIENTTRAFVSLCDNYNNTQSMIGIVNTLKKDSEAGKLDYELMLNAFCNMADTYMNSSIETLTDVVKNLKDVSSTSMCGVYQLETVAEKLKLDSRQYKAAVTNAELIEAMRNYKITE